MSTHHEPVGMIGAVEEKYKALAALIAAVTRGQNDEIMPCLENCLLHGISRRQIAASAACLHDAAAITRISAALAGIAVPSKAEMYEQLAQQAESLLVAGEALITSTANLAALLYDTLPDVNWAGFYLLDGDKLILGPFQGRTACTVIALGKGVCGTAAAERRTVVVPDVHAFPGHIACDSQSNSEVVIPILKDGALIGVLDLDSPLLNRFDDADAAGLERLVEIFTARLGAKK